jgi:hypothetical protein
MAKWESAEIEILKRLYEENNVPSDQLVKDKDALKRFVTIFSQKVGQEKSYTDKEVADQLFKLRKSGKLPRIRK